MRRTNLGKIIVLASLLVLALPSYSFSLTPPNPTGSKVPPVPELIVVPSTPKSSNPISIHPNPSELTRPFPLEEENLDKVANDLPPIIKPSQEEIKEKVILELKELEKDRGYKTKASFDFPIVINDQVEYFIDYFQTRLRNRFSLWMARSTRFMPMMKKILAEHGLPEDLVYLAMIESGFSTKAYSRAHAVGPWQFIRETGQRYGLRVSAWVDERKDPVKSTRAAAKHLADLFNRFGSWYLAAAGYNAGEGKISRALSMYNAQNFWDLTAEHRRYIKEETKQYVPKMIAAALIAKEPEKYGFFEIPYQSPLSYEEVPLPGGVELKEVAASCGVDVETIVDLNPELRRWITPPGDSEYTLRIPTGSKDRLMANYDQLIKPKSVLTYKEHRIKKGERLASIAKRYGVKPNLIADINRIKGKGDLNPGLVLLIPQKGGTSGLNGDIGLIDQENHFEKKPSQRTAKNNREGKSTAGINKKIEDGDQLQAIRYKVKKGDSLNSIAGKFDVDVSLIKKWNPKGGKKIQAGTTLTLFVPKNNSEREIKKENGKSNKPNQKKIKADGGEKFKTVRYTVKKGDSLAEIAQRFQITPDQIRTWNRLSDKKTIKPGDKLDLRVTKLSPEKI
jgi:membrane-bound lytic murein transglycosylase D